MQKTTKNPISQANKRKQKKAQFLTKLHDENGNSILPLGAYSKIAKKLKISQSYVRFCLSEKYPHWSEKVAAEATKLIRIEANNWAKINEQIAAAVKKYKEVHNVDVL